MSSGSPAPLDSVTLQGCSTDEGAKCALGYAAREPLSGSRRLNSLRPIVPWICKWRRLRLAIELPTFRGSRIALSERWTSHQRQVSRRERFRPLARSTARATRTAIGTNASVRQ